MNSYFLFLLIIHLILNVLSSLLNFDVMKSSNFDAKKIQVVAELTLSQSRHAGKGVFSCFQGHFFFSFFFFKFILCNFSVRTLKHFQKIYKIFLSSPKI